jgi:hypothetical protein
MMESWTEPGFTKRGRGRMGIMGGIATWAGVAFAIIGVVSESIERLIGLTPYSWYYLAIATLIFGLCCWLGWAVGMYFHVKETQGEKEE